MNLDRILKEVKSTMASDLSRISIDDVEKFVELNTSYMNIFSALSSLKKVRESFIELMFKSVDEKVSGKDWLSEVSVTNSLIDDPLINVESKDNVLDYSSEHVDDEVRIIGSVKDKVDKDKVYVFERLVRGGKLIGLDCYVPERIIRELDLKSGDKIIAEKLNTNLEYSEKYTYSLFERSRLEVKDVKRKQYNMCPVELSGDKLVVSKSLETNQNIRENGLDIELSLSNKDIKSYKIKEGSVIDIAYTNSKHPLVLYKHSSHVLHMNTSGLKKHTQFKISESRDNLIDSTSLKGKVILIIGNDLEKEGYQEEIERRSGILEWYPSDTDLEVLESVIKRVDLVVTMKDFISSIMHSRLKGYSLKHSTPFRYTPLCKSKSVGRFIERTIRYLEAKRVHSC